MSTDIITTSDLDEATVVLPAISEHSGETYRENRLDRWHDLTVYATPDGDHVCHIEFFTNWQEEMELDFLIRFHALAELRQQLIAHSKTIPEYVRGFPPLPGYAQRQSNLMNWIRARFGDLGKHLVTDLRALGLE